MRNDRIMRVQALGRSRGRLRDVYYNLVRLSWPQLFAIFVLSFLAFNLLFAWLYSLDPNGLSRSADPVRASYFWDEFFFSVHTVATIGYGNVYPVSFYANVLVVIEITIGILFFAMATGIAFARFSLPVARVLFSNVAVIAKVEGIPTLMFRAANQRRNFVFEARADVSLLADERVDGRTMRRFRDLALQRSSTPVFTLTWTVMHRIDETSPIASWLKEKDIPADAEIIVILSGIDGHTGQTIRARWAYARSHIFWDSRFVDILGMTEDGVRTIDYDHFHDVIPDAAVEVAA
jgi:inward rectifier potassium channel